MCIRFYLTGLCFLLSFTSLSLNPYDSLAEPPNENRVAGKISSNRIRLYKPEIHAQLLKQMKYKPSNRKQNSLIQPVKAIQKKSKMSMLLVNASDGRIILQSNCDDERYPASLTKLMTIYLAFDAIKSGLIGWNQQLITSERASEQEPSKLGLEQGEKITVRDSIISLIVKSANDASVVVAENIGMIYSRDKKADFTKDSARYEKVFVNIMNKKAKELKMFNTAFTNPSGLHDANQKTNAVDMAIMAHAIKRDFPKYYKLFSKISHTYKDKELLTTNEITKTYPGAEGMKTGYTRASGFNLVTTVKRGKIEIIAVVMGGESSESRNGVMAQLLDLGIEKVFGMQTNKVHKNTIFSPSKNISEMLIKTSG